MTEPTSTLTGADGDRNPTSIGDRKYESWGLAEAAAFLRIHPATLSERARAGAIPGCKIGRSWVFMPELLAEYLHTKSTEKVERVKQRPSATTTLAQRLAARRAQRIDNRRRSSRDLNEADALTSRKTNGQFRPGFGRPPIK